MDDFSRELGQFEKQLENLANNFQKIGITLERLFDRIEIDSKSTLKELSRLESDLKSELIKREELDRRFEEVKALSENNRKTLNTEKLIQSNFETEIKTGVRAAKIFGGIATGLAAIAATISTVIALIK